MGPWRNLLGNPTVSHYLVRGDSTHDHCAWAIISNTLIDGFMDPVMKEAVGCVGDNWPAAFQVHLLSQLPGTEPPETEPPDPDTSLSYRTSSNLMQLLNSVSAWFLFSFL